MFASESVYCVADLRVSLFQIGNVAVKAAHGEFSRFRRDCIGKREAATENDGQTEHAGGERAGGEFRVGEYLGWMLRRLIVFRNARVSCHGDRSLQN